MNRRSVLTTFGAAAATALFAGCGEAGPARDPTSTADTTTGGESEPPTDANQLSSVAREWGFERIVDLETRGADTSGRSPIDDIFRDTLTEDTLIYLPPGRYRVEESLVTDGVKRLGMVGDGATIVPEDGFDGTIFGLGWPERSERLLVSGLEFDFTAPETGGRPILAMARDRIVLRDVSVTGLVDVDQDQIRIDVIGEDGTGLVERLSLPDGAHPDYKVTGCEVGNENRGDLAFVDCEINGFPDNGLYADPPEGAVEVHGGTFRNNGIAGVRVNANAPSVVRGVHVICDADVGGANMRGIRLRGGTQISVEDCLVELHEVTSSDGALVLSKELGGATIRNCRLHVDADGINGIRIKSAASDADSRDGPFRFENVYITGNAADGEAVYAANRNGCSFSKLCIHQTGDGRDGFVFTDVEGEVLDSHVAVTGDPFRETRSEIRRSNLSLARTPTNVSDRPFDRCRFRLGPP